MHIPCVYCDGMGETLMHLHCADRPGEWHYLRCQDCDGTGIITQAQHAMYTEGRLRRDLRVLTGLTQHQMATWFGVSSAEYSQMEYGRRPWPEGSEAAFDTALSELSIRRHLEMCNDILEQRAKRGGI